MKHKYHCWNWECKAYCGRGNMIYSREPIRDLRCPHCGGPLEDCSDDAPPWVYVLSAVIAGWFMGLIIDGWTGSLVGFAAGLVIGLMVYVFYREEPYQ